MPTSGNGSTRLEMDFLADGDGGIDYDQVIPSSDWAPLHYQVKTPTGFWKVRFILRKDGSGRAVLARIRATAGSDCSGAAIARRSRPSGISCEPAILLIWYSFGSRTSTIVSTSPRSSRFFKSTDAISIVLPDIGIEEC